MKYLKDKDVRLRAWLFPIAALLWNIVVYCGSQLVHGLPIHDWTLPIDGKIPFFPWTVFVYFLAYLFWAVNYVFIAVQEKPHAYRFFCADFLSHGVCLIFFLFLPTTNVRPEVEGTGLWAELMRFLYWVDEPLNLFPSIHCMVSWQCWIGVRRRESIPRWYKHFTFWMAAAVCISTLTTRQHVLVDAAGGIVLAEVCWRMAGLGPVLRKYTCIMDNFSRGIAHVLSIRK